MGKGKRVRGPKWQSPHKNKYREPVGRFTEEDSGHASQRSRNYYGARVGVGRSKK